MSKFVKRLFICLVVLVSLCSCNSIKYGELFDHNGYYYETDQYFINGITVNIKPTIDENGCITKIEGYKAKSIYNGHGRPRTEYRDFSKRDITHFSKILDMVTENIEI